MQVFSTRLFVAMFAVSFLVSPLSTAQAAGEKAETPASNMNISLTAEPARYTFVKGDASKFRALHWMEDGYAFGVNDFTLKTELENDVTLESEGHGIPEDGDYSGDVTLKKEDLWYLAFNYDQFRKYFSNGGGLFRPYVDLAQNYTDRELELNIGKFGAEFGLTLKNLPDIVLNYEREFKEGTKSRLTWASRYDAAPSAGTGTLQRKIGPSWQDIDEITDSFNVKISDTFNDFNWKADQHWEFTRANNMHENRNLATTATASNYQALDVYQKPRTDLMSTTLGLDRWFSKDRVYVSSGYRFSQIDSRELFNLLTLTKERDAFLPGGTNYLDSPSDNHFVSQTWVGSLMTTLFNPLTAIMKMKIERTHRNSSSTWIADTSTAPAVPNGIIDRIYVSENQEKVARYGESMSFRYNGIPWMALYNDYDLEQFESNLHKGRTTGYNPLTSSDVYQIRNVEKTFRETITLGAQIFPAKHVTMTIQGQHRWYDSDFDHVTYSIAPATVLIPTWYDAQHVRTDEAAARISWKPCRWFQPTFRYQLSDKVFETMTLPDSDIAVTTAQISSTYTWDLSSQPMDDLLMTASFSYQDGKVITPTRFDGSFPLPTFDFDVYTTLFTAEYALNKDLILTGTADYTRAANFQDFSSVSMPYGADFHSADITAGLRWTPKKDLTIEPKYAWYQYSANEAEVGSYNAQMVSLNVKLLWG